MADAPLRHYLIDGSGFIFRAFHALPPMTRRDGTHVNAVFGFTSMLMKLLRDMKADHVAVIFDAGRETFRNKIYDAYKANRPEPPPELIPQFALVREATRAFNVPAVELPGYEADDLIATYARQAVARGDEVVIVSSDKDLMQLVGERVEMFDPLKNRRIGRAEVVEKFGVEPEKVVDVQALAGDSTDNVPGVPGIGIKTAAQLIAEYGDLDTLLARAGEIKQPKRRETLVGNADKARLSRELVRLKDDSPVTESLDDLVVRPLDPARLKAFLEAQDFRALIARFDLAATPAATAAPGGVPVTGAAAPTIAPAPAAGSAVGGPIDRSGYELVQDVARLKHWVERAREIGLVAFDTETTSLDPMRAELVGFSLALAPGEACYVPVGHRARGAGAGTLDLGRDERPRQIPLDAALTLIAPVLADPAVLKIGQNIKYDMAVLARYDVPIRAFDDTMLISYALDGGRHGHGMDELSGLHLGHTPISYNEVTGTGRERISFAEVALDKARDYAAEDADVTWRLHRALKPRLLAERAMTVYETLERPLVPVLVAMERAGVLVDRKALADLSRDFAGRLVQFEAEIHKLAGHAFNVGSPKQLGQILFDEMGLPGGRKGKTGAYSTDSDVLEPLAAQGHQIAEKVLDWRQLQKLKSTYADALVDQIDPQTGRVHTSYAMAATTTGRLSSTDPNLQNIPVRTEEGRRIRRAFVAAPGNKLLSVDYSQIELRLVAEIGAIDSLKQAFVDGIDIHALTASQVFGVPLDQMDSQTRRRAKAINFGIIYGISGFGLARQLGCSQGEANAFIQAYFARYPGIRAYMERTRQQAREQGYVTTLFGRRCHVPGILDKNPARRGFAERQAINAPIQGTAADVMRRAMIRMADALVAERLAARMLLQVHDELLFEVPEAEIEQTSAVARRVMEAAAAPAVRLGVPLVAEAGVGANWAEAH